LGDYGLAMLWLRGKRLFDGYRDVDVPTVTISDATVVAVGDERPPAGADVVELDAALLPGLVDCHQHLCFEALSEDAAETPSVALAAQAERSARRALAAGITTIRDLGDRDYVTLPLRSRDDLPTLLCSGPPITAPEGHCWYLGGEVDPASGQDALRAAVRERIGRGCDVVKIMVTGGFLTPTHPMWSPQFSLDDLRVMVDEAHQHGVPVAAHCHGPAGIEQAVRVRVDTIEHCSFVDEGVVIDPDPELLQMVADSKIPASVTIGRLPSMPQPEILARLQAPGRATRRRLHELGATLVPGTDAGIGPAKPHDVMTHALAELVACGLTPRRALQAMTADAAGACGVGNSNGRIAVGFEADVVAFAGHPADEPDAIHEPVAVWNRGARCR
jgi:imidazolonepropionase-like amidohydrolase